MTDRAYTVKELDALRHVVEERLLWGRYSGPVCVDGGAWTTSNPSAKDIEERVRTHMLAGHTAQDLLASEQSS